MKIFLYLFTFLFPFMSYGQKPLYEKVMTWQSVHEPENIQPFHTIEKRGYSVIKKGIVKDYALFGLNPRQVDKMVTNKPEFVRLEVPVESGEPVHLLMVLEDVVTPSFKAVTSADPERAFELPSGSHYRGIIEGQPESFAAVSFFENNIIGVFSGDDTGNHVIGKLEGENTFISYNDANITNPPVMECWNEYLSSLMPSEEATDGTRQGLSISEAPPCKQIKIYVETDYLMYQEKGRSKTRVIQDVNGMFNVVAALYENEGINVKVNKIVVWTSKDPYNTQNSFQAIRDFGARVRDNFDGDLGHLLSRTPNNLGGVGWIDKLCTRYNSGTGQGRVAYSNIGTSYRKLPTYSWSVNVLTHEMGHNLGSYHTHSCRWNGNNTQIDDCGNIFASNNGNTPEGQRCFDKRNPIVPSRGGTIMSYCHLNQVGIRFSNGFGEQPGDVIRGKVARARCLGGAFNAEAFPKGPVDLYYGDSTLLRSTPSGAAYTRQWYLNDEPIAGATKSTIKVGQPGKYRVEVVKDCSVFSNEVNVVGKEFIASINYPAIKGDSGEVKFESTLSLPSGKKDTMIIDVPVDVLEMLQQDLLHWDVEMKTYIKYGRPGDISILKMGVLGPMGSGIYLPNYDPTKDEKPTQRSVRYYKFFDRINPGGIWRFPLYNPNDSNKVSRKMSVNVTLTLRWKAKSRPSDQDIFQCDGPDMVTLDPQLSGDSYQWSTGETTRTITVSEGGYYAVTVTKGVLISNDDVNVTFKPEAVNKDTTICQGMEISFGRLKIDEPGDYTQSFTDTSGCEQVVNLHVEVLPSSTSSQSLALCYGMMFLGEERIVDDTLEETLVAANGCDSVVTYYIEVQPEIVPKVRYDTGCYQAGTRVVLSSPEGKAYSYRWQDGISGDSVAMVSDTQAKVVVVSGDCEREVILQIPHFPKVSFDAKASDVLCFGEDNGSIVLDRLHGDWPFTFYVNGEVNHLQDGKIRVGRGEYEVYVEDANNCKSDTTVFKINQPDSLQLSPTITNTKPGKEVGSISIEVRGGVAPYSYKWSTGDTTAIIDHLAKGIYTVKITDANNCMRSYDIEVKESVATVTPGIFESIGIFPNPANDVLNIRMTLSQPQEVNFRLYDARGAVIRQENLRAKVDFGMKWYTSDLDSGVYYIQITTNQGSTTRKICIAK